MTLTAPSTPLEWTDYLHAKLRDKQSKIQVYDEYYEGEKQKLAFAQARFRSAFGDLFERFSDNFCGLIVDSLAERMRIEGIRMTEEPGADKDAQEIWQRNSLDADAPSAHLDALVHGESYGVVWGDSDGQPIVSVESAENVAVHMRPGSRRDVVAALKVYSDEWGTERSTLVLPTSVWQSTQTRAGHWAEPIYSRNPLGFCPVTAIQNRPRLSGKAFSELKSVIPLQDAVNKVVIDALVASEYAAWPQRYVTGMEIQEDSDGRPVEPYRLAIDRLLQAEDPNTRFGQFDPANLANYVTLVEMLVQHLASTSRVPFHYFLLNGGQSPSGEAITSAEAGLVAKARERMIYFGEAWERIMRHCFAVLGDPRARAYSAEVMWGDPEYRTESQHIDALTKLRTLRVPLLQLWQDAGYSPQQIARFPAMLTDESRFVGELGPPAGTDLVDRVDDAGGHAA
ncbi:phage portal protein [Yinghuangia sp. YIM S09857]|uniref:phage portal protein n=1 Tax=Yinghuangia sp. YIM S09857 TaxID=3436929 RepID=UPI003F52C9AE